MSPRIYAATFAATVALLGGCGARSTYDFDYAIEPPQPATPSGDESCGAPEGVCATRTCAPPLVEAKHVDVCSTIVFTSNPPTSGPHFPIWGLFKAYDSPLARGFYLHDAEHSGVILLYNCDRFTDPSACAATVSQMKDYAAARPADPKCEAPTRNRVIVTPDPYLDVPVAAVAWGHSLKAQCFDPAQADAFIAAHYGKNYEDLCSGGVDPTDPASGFDPNCGL